MNTKIPMQYSSQKKQCEMSSMSKFVVFIKTVGEKYLCALLLPSKICVQWTLNYSMRPKDMIHRRCGEAMKLMLDSAKSAAGLHSYYMHGYFIEQSLIKCSTCYDGMRFQMHQ